MRNVTAGYVYLISIISYNYIGTKRALQHLCILDFKAAARDSESGLVHRCCPSVCLYVCLSPKCKKRDFSQKLSNLEL